MPQPFGGGGQAPSTSLRSLLPEANFEFQGSSSVATPNLTMPSGARVSLQSSNNDVLMRQLTNPNSARFKMGVDDMNVMRNGIDGNGKYLLNSGSGASGGASSGGIGSGGTPIF